LSHWVFHNPVRIAFGEGAFDQIGHAIAGRSFVLVTNNEPALLPWRERLAQLCGQPLLTLDSIAPNPDLATLRLLSEELRDLGRAPELFVALGGGSAIDAAKFLAAGHGQFDELFASIEAGTPLPRPALPFIAIPTTAGTGSDLTRWATVWDNAGGRKLSLERDDLFAEASFIDPLIMASLPWSVALASGLDALSHALESIWNINANPLTRDFAVRGARDVMAALPLLQADQEDANARAQLAKGAMGASLAFSNTRTALAHNLSYPITLQYGVTHGIACSFCLPEVMAAVIGVDPDCDAALSEIIGPLVDAPTRLRAFLDSLGVPASAHALKITPDAWEVMVDQAFAGPRGRNFIGSRERFSLVPVSAVIAEGGE